MANTGLQTPIRAALARVELWLEAERDHLPLWLPVLLGCGIAGWFAFPLQQQWVAMILGGFSCAALGIAVGLKRRLGFALFWAGVMLALGCSLVWWRAERLSHIIIERRMITEVSGTVKRVDQRLAEGKIRLLIAPVESAGMPPLVRVTAPIANVPAGLASGSRITVRARLVPPPQPALPGGYDFARAAWFQQLGATGIALGDVKLDGAAAPPGLRVRLSEHVRAQVPGSEGGIAAAFASGDRGGIAPEDEEAMRASGLTHLLSISGLHITAVVGAAMFLALRLLALSPRLALGWPLLTISAGFGALTGVGYTLLTGAEVPTIRSCIAALLVLGGLVLGREALTLRLVATGALIILLLWPEALVGASFQLSFAAIASIVAFHENRTVKAWLSRREETLARGLGRGFLGLLATGVVVEAALAPIALFHFHKSGLYGALANIIAIPWTTFVIMPLEALALLLDLAGLGAPLWWVTGQAISLLIWLAHLVAGLPGAMATLPSIPVPAFALMLLGGFWTLIWTQRPRWMGLLPFLIGAGLALATPAPDILVTGDGRHLALRGADGNMAMLREKAGDFVKSQLTERAGESEPLGSIDSLANARCGPDMCIADVTGQGATWRVGATRSAHLLPWKELVALCPKLDLLVSDRRLPPDCAPRVLKADRPGLLKTGGLAVTLGRPPHIEQVLEPEDDHPWLRAAAKPDNER